MKKTLKDYTPEIRAKVAEYKKKCIEDLYSGKEHAEYKKENTVKYIHYLYEFCKRDKPVVIIANTPGEYKLWYNLLFNSSIYTEKVNAKFLLINNKFKNEEEKKFLEKVSNREVTEKLDFSKKIQAKYHWLFAASEYARVYMMWYKFIKDEFGLPCKKSDVLDHLYDSVNSANIAKCYFTHRVALVLRMPKKILRNNVGFHCPTNEGAIQYSSKEKFHYLNGRKVPDWVYDKYFSKTLTFEDFTKEVNEDVKGCIVTLIKENEGNEGLLKFLSANLVDEKTLTHTNGQKETLKLYKTKNKFTFAKDSNGRENVELSWLEETCPSTGQTYLIDVCPTLNTALDAAKFCRPKHVDLNVEYNWEQFTN